jgi:hypothetical protein
MRAVACCNLGLGAANLGLGALYLDLHKPIFSVIWMLCGLGWFAVAWMNWRTHRIRDHTRRIRERMRQGGDW